MKRVKQMVEIPTYEEFMYPYLEKYRDGEPHRLRDFIEALAEELTIDHNLRNKRLPSGKDTFLRNRIGWAQFYLLKAGLLKRVSRATYQITERGMSYLRNNEITSLTKKDLEMIKEFKEFLDQSDDKKDSKEVKTEETKDKMTETPYERIINNHIILKEAIKSELLENILNSTSNFFEELIIHLIVSMGYGGNLKEAGEKLGKTGDGGIDGVIKEDVLGLENIYLQAKRYNINNSVSSRDIRDFIGSLVTNNGRKGIFITTSSFTKSAQETAESSPHKVILIDGEQLTDYMFDYNVGVQVEETIAIKKIDFDFFEEE